MNTKFAPSDDTLKPWATDPIPAPPEMVVLSVVLSKDQHDRLEIAANYTEASTSYLLRRAVDDVLERRLTSLDDEQFEEQLYEALVRESVEDRRPYGDGQTVGVRITAEAKDRLDWLSKALRSSASALVREGLETVVAGELGDRDLEQLRREIAARLTSRAQLYRGGARPAANPTDSSVSVRTV